MPSEFEQHVYEAAEAAVRSAPLDERGDTYVVSFFVYDEEDDPRRPTVTVGTNTESQVRLAVDPPADFVKPNPWWSPADPDEARWNYAFWQQNALASIADTGRDPRGSTLREQWVRNAGWWVDEPSGDDWDEFEAKGAEITAAFVRLCVATSLRLHASGVLDEVFSRPLPIVIHELEYYDEIAEQTLEANPDGLADDFAAWVNAF